ncbi:MAG: sulfotransferase [Streptosporangiaceae bacterium]|nr:sulfotransferase [Streptosporangiaceae bacterium]
MTTTTSMDHDAPLTIRPRCTEHAPLFLLAPIRSFSTVSLALLGGHPDLYGFPEMLLFSVPDVAGLLTEQARRPDLPRPWARSRLTGVLRAVAELHERSQSPDAIARAEAWLGQRAEWPTVRLMDHLLDLVRPRTGLEKSPDSTHSDQALDACITAYPNARFIHLTRHPVTTQRSMHQHMRPRWADNGQSLIVRSASAWYLAHLRVAKRLARMPSERWLRVRAEDLLRDPDHWIRQICEWLGLTCDAGIIGRMLRTEDWQFAGHGMSGDLGGGDAKFLRTPKLRTIPEPGPVIFDPAWGLHPEMTRRMTRLAAFLGY